MLPYRIGILGSLCEMINPRSAELEGHIIPFGSALHADGGARDLDNNFWTLFV